MNPSNEGFIFSCIFIHMDYLVTVDQLVNVIDSYIGPLNKKRYLGSDTWYNTNGDVVFRKGSGKFDFGIDENIFYDIQGLLNITNGKDDSMLFDVLERYVSIKSGSQVTDLYMF